jgi:hypothetical protein
LHRVLRTRNKGHFSARNWLSDPYKGWKSVVAPGDDRGLYPSATVSSKRDKVDAKSISSSLKLGLSPIEKARRDLSFPSLGKVDVVDVCIPFPGLPKKNQVMGHSRAWHKPLGKLGRKADYDAVYFHVYDERLFRRYIHLRWRIEESAKQLLYSVNKKGCLSKTTPKVIRRLVYQYHFMLGYLVPEHGRWCLSRESLGPLFELVQGFFVRLKRRGSSSRAEPSL